MLKEADLEKVARIPSMSAMLLTQDYLLLGSQNGEIHLVKPNAIFIQNTAIDKIPSEDMCQSKTYPAHASFVNQLQMYTSSLNKTSLSPPLFSVGILDECIFKWRVKEEKAMWNLDNLDYPVSELNVDMFNETMPKPKFSNLVNDLLPLRNEISEALLRKDHTQQPAIELILENVIGRTALCSRNNLFYDCLNRTVFLSGANLVINDFRNQFKSGRVYATFEDAEFKEDTEKHLYQEFILLEKESFDQESNQKTQA